MNDTPLKTNLLGLEEKALKQFFVEQSEKPFRGTQVLKWIHQKGVSKFEDMTDLSVELRQRLEQVACIEGPQIAEEQLSRDGTRKWLLQLADGNKIETVFIPEANRGTLCISSQVGCALNCRFCSTATQGFNRNLTTAEIIGQLWLATQKVESRISNIVMMGMGEPLLNYDAVLSAMAIMRDDNAYGLSRRRVTLSTAGLIPNILRLGKEADVSLAVSLHASNDQVRDALVPLNKKYPIAELMLACKNYVGQDKRRHITMEYVMLKNVNDRQEHAKELIKLLRNIPCKVNLIPFNPFPMTKFECSDPETIEAFRQTLMQGDLIVTVRKTRGQDIDAACGQLKGRIVDRTSRSTRQKHVYFKEEALWMAEKKQAVC